MPDEDRLIIEYVRACRKYREALATIQASVEVAKTVLKAVEDWRGLTVRPDGKIRPPEGKPGSEVLDISAWSLGTEFANAFRAYRDGLAEAQKLWKTLDDKGWTAGLMQPNSGE